MNSWDAMVDNTTDIAALAAAQPIDAETTWLLCVGLFNNGYNNYFRLKDFEMASRVKFVRELGNHTTEDGFCQMRSRVTRFLNLKWAVTCICFRSPDRYR